MKIVIHVTNFLPYCIAGTELNSYKLALYMARRGHEVHVVTSHDAGLPYDSMENGFYIHRIPYPRMRFIGGFTFWTKVFLLLTKIRPDIIQCQGIGCCCPSLLAQSVYHIPFIASAQGSDIYMPDWFTQISSKKVIRSASAVFAMTEHMKREIQKIYPRDIIIVPNAIEVDKFKKKNVVKPEKDGKTVLFIGRLHPVKGIQYLIEAMALVRPIVPESKLIIIGDGPEKTNLERLVTLRQLEDAIQFVGYVTQEKLPEYVGSADLFVLSSISEGFPTVILEAMASGLPIIATNVGGVREIVEEGVNGYLVPPKDQKQLAERMIMLLQSKKMRQDMSMHNSEKAERYSWMEVSSYVEGIYQEVIAQYNNRDSRQP